MQECSVVLCSHHFSLILLMLRLIHRFIISDCNFSCFFPSVSFYHRFVSFSCVRALFHSFFFSTLITSHLFYSIDSWLLPSCSTICFILSFSWCRDNNMWAFCYIFYYARFTLEHRWDDAWKVLLHFKTTALLCFMCVIFTKLTVRFLKVFFFFIFLLFVFVFVLQCSIVLWHFYVDF